MDKSYKHSGKKILNTPDIEARWQSVWQETRLYEVDLNTAGNPFYNLMMFPYPSAEGLHVGNVYAFVGSDIYGRFMAMNGNDVFEPIGFDAFGIHSENFAIKRGVHPKLLTSQNVKRFRDTQLKRIGNRFDWSHEVQTTDPSYYKWTQWIFLQLFKKGLAVRRKAYVNWCPSCKTVLADEQVINNLCERCGNEVTQKELEQWFLKITSYAERLLDNLKDLDWSEKVKAAQMNWIGRSEGLVFEMMISGKSDVHISVFTTRPDTIFGMTYVVLAPEHPLVDELTTNEKRESIETYKAATRRKSEFQRVSEVREKSGVFTGSYAVNPINQESIPIWISDYVLPHYGTGAIMGVPSHDQRDLEFAKTFRLSVRNVIIPKGSANVTKRSPDSAYTGPGVLTNSGNFDGMQSDRASEEIISWFEKRKLGFRTIKYRLKDWLISRQRYWGPPIPIIYCDSCGTVPVPADQLPVMLPDIEDWLPTGTGRSPLADSASFVDTRCPSCDAPARRETDVSDNFLDSAWYFLRYPSVGFNDTAFDRSLTTKWLPVDMYIGGPEHSVLHLLYSRFITMALHDLGFLAFDEPFKKFRAHGFITKDGTKMSKSKGNVVNPDEYIERFGADTLRIYLMFLGPFDQGGDFTDRGMAGIHRFLRRVSILVHEHYQSLQNADLDLESSRQLHRTIQVVTEDVMKLRYNTAIAILMEYLNYLQGKSRLYQEEISVFLRLLAPFAPHLSEDLWQFIGGTFSVHQQAWPKVRTEFLAIDEVNVAVQVNGKTRAIIRLPVDATKDKALAVAMQVPSVMRHIGVESVNRVVYVPNKILNIVI